MAGKEMSKGSAISVTVADPWARRDMMARRVGSASAAKVLFRGDALYLTIPLTIVVLMNSSVKLIVIQVHNRDAELAGFENKVGAKNLRRISRINTNYLSKLEQLV